MNRTDTELKRQPLLNDQRLLDWLSGPVGQTTETPFGSLSESDWDGIIEASVKHGVRPLLFQRLAGAGEATTPERVLRDLREAFLLNGAKNMALYQSLGQALRAFQKEDISVIVLKGAHLADQVYDNRALRPMADIDLLVRKTDLARAAGTLAQIGYSSEPGDIEEWQKDFRHHHLPSFSKPPDSRIEIHWTILPSAHSISMSGLWSRSRPVVIEGVEGRVLSPEDLILHLCLHMGFQHQFSVGLRPLCDISAAIRRYGGEISWEQIELRAREWRMERYVYLALCLGSALLKAPIPSAFLQELRPKDEDPCWSEIAKDLVLQGQESLIEGNPHVQTWKAFANGCGSASLPGKVKFLYKTTFPSREYIELYMKSRRLSFRKRPPLWWCYIVRATDLILRVSRLAWLCVGLGDKKAYQARLLRNQIFLQTWLDKSNEGGA